MNRPASTPNSAERRILAVAGQGFALGLTAAWITVPASAIFLQAYGPALLPVTYIGAAVAGAGSSTLLARALRRRPIAAVATSVLLGLLVLLTTSWLALANASLDWVAFALVTLVPIIIPVGFVFLVGQAGALVDLRSLKALYARVVAGFAFGFVTGGLMSPVLLALLGRTEHLLAAGAGSAAIFLGLVIATRRRYPAELSLVERGDEPGDRPTLRALARDRYLLLLIAFQMLSALESQLLDFLVYRGAAERYGDAEQLAQFVSRFSAIAYGADILFLLLLAGLLLRRFGLRYGLLANSTAVLGLVLAIIAGTVLQGSASTAVFVLVVAVRVTDLTLGDGAARTSMSAAYQAVPVRMRAVAQAAVESLAVPVAIGVSGVVLLVVDAVGAMDGATLPALVAVIVTIWLIVASLAYREYRVSILANLRGRILDPAELTLDDEGGLIAIDRLIQSDDERDIRLGLDILTTARHPQLPLRLQRLVVDQRVNVRTDALERLVQLAPDMAATAARAAIDEPEPEVRAAATRVLGAAGHLPDLLAIAARARDPAPEVRVAVVAALSQAGDDRFREHIRTEIMDLAGSEDAANRALAAAMLGVSRGAGPEDRQPLADLIDDADDEVSRAALRALRCPGDEGCLAIAARQLLRPTVSASAAEALVRAGLPALTLVDTGLREGTPRRTREALARIARDIGGSEAAAVLRRHVDHPDRDVGLAVMQALAVVAPPAAPALITDAGTTPTLGTPPGSAVARDDLDHATRVLAALVEFADEPAAVVLEAALRDELTLLRRRVLAALSIRHGIDGLNRVVFHLAQRDQQDHALAIEWLDLTLHGTDRAVLALLEPGRTDRQRLQSLTCWFPQDPIDRHSRIRDLALDPERSWRRPWIAACALHAARGLTDVGLDALIVEATEWWVGRDGEPERIVFETAAGLGSRRLDPV